MRNIINCVLLENEERITKNLCGLNIESATASHTHRLSDIGTTRSY